jgi:cytochrome P450
MCLQSIDAVVQRRKQMSRGERRDLLQHLIEEGKRPDNGETMTTRDIVDQLAEMLLAGSETTSGTLGSLFLELARNPTVRAKPLASLPPQSLADDIVSSKTVRSEPQYEYLEACIKENLRLHPIASEMGRRTGDQWINLMGYDLPPHTVVSVSYRDLHRNDEFWPQAQRFWPERWLPRDKRGDAPAAEYVSNINARPALSTSDQHGGVLSILGRQPFLYRNQVSLSMVDWLHYLIVPT